MIVWSLPRCAIFIGSWPLPSPLRRGDCCMSHHGLFFEPPPLDTSAAAPEEEARTRQAGAEDAVWKRSRPSGAFQTHVFDLSRTNRRLSQATLTSQGIQRLLSTCWMCEIVRPVVFHPTHPDATAQRPHEFLPRTACWSKVAYHTTWSAFAGTFPAGKFAV